MVVQAAADRKSLAAVAPRWSLAQYLLVALAVLAFLIGLDLADGTLHNGDVDDILRALEVRTFLDTGNWFDMTLPMVRMPEPYLSAWSRLVDVPYAAIAALLRSEFGEARALHLAFAIWPAVMGVLYCLLVLGILRRIAPLKADVPATTLLVILFFMAHAIWEFSPGRIDHHNVQMLLLLAMLYGATRHDRSGGAAAGLGAALSVAVGLETAPFVAVILAALTGTWIMGAQGSGRTLSGLGVACLVATPLLGLLLIGPSAFLVAHNDAFSAPFIYALAGFGLIVLICPMVLSERSACLSKFLVIAIAGLMLLLAILWCYPALLEGPFPIVDPLTHLYWFDRINQEKNALQFYRIGDYGSLALLAIMICIAICSLPTVVRAGRAGQPVLPVLYAAALCAIAMVLASNRFLRFSTVVVPLFLPIVFAALRDVGDRAAHRSRERTALIAAIAAVAVVVTSIHWFVPKVAQPPDAFDYLMMDTCDGQDFAAVQKIPAGSIFAPPGMGLKIAQAAHAGVTVSSIPYHRASPGIRHVLQVYMAPGDAERRALLQGFDYFVICRAPTGLSGEKAMPLFASLMKGDPIPGLTPVPDGTKSNVLLFRIEPAATK